METNTEGGEVPEPTKERITEVQIIKKHSPNPTSGYDNSWIKDAMNEFAQQELQAYREAVRKSLEGFTEEEVSDDPEIVKFYQGVVKALLKSTLPPPQQESES